VEIWHVHKNSPRVDQEREIHNHLKNADIILIFLSPDYMDADFLANRLIKKLSINRRF
jgi:hypothetical protein